MILGATGRQAALDMMIRDARLYARDVPPSEGGSTFTVTVATEYGPLAPQEVQASSLVEALVRAIAVPFPAWFPDEHENAAPTNEKPGVHQVEVFWRGKPKSYGWQCLDCESEVTGMETAEHAENDARTHGVIVT